MSLSRKPTTVKELKAALASLKDTDKVAIYEASDIIKMPAISYLKATGRTVIII